MPTQTSTVSDKVAVQETGLVALPSVVLAADNASGQEVTTARIPTSQRISLDNLGVNEVTSRLRNLLRTVSDNLGISEVIKDIVGILWLKSVVDNLGLNESVGRVFVPQRVVSDLMALREIFRFPSPIIKIWQLSPSPVTYSTWLVRPRSNVRAFSVFVKDNIGGQDATSYNTFVSPTTFSTTVQITRSTDKIVMPLGNSVTVTYKISGQGATSAQLVRTDGAVPVSLTCDGAQHTISFTPSLSQLYFINASDVNGSIIDRLEIIVQQSLTATDPTAAATITTQRSGTWNDTNPATTPWPSGILPGVNDIVSNAFALKANSRVDGSGNILQCARFINQSGGTLNIWNDGSTAAAVWMTDYVGKTGSTLNMDSTFTVGTVAVMLMRNRPFSANDTAGNSPDGFSNYWNAVDIRGGNLTMNGTVVTPYSRAVGDIAAGATFVDLQEAVTGWAKSFLLVLPDTRGTRGSTDFTDQTEVAIIRGIGNDGSGNPNRRVYFVRPTLYAHPMARNVDGTPAIRTWDSVPLTAHLVCMSKTCGIITEDPTGIGGLGGQPRAHMFLGGGGRVDCREAMVSHGMGRCTITSMGGGGGSLFNNNPSYSPANHRLFPILTFDLHGPAGGLGYDATVDELEFKPGDPANIFGLNGPSHRFINCLALDPFEDNGTGGPPSPVATGGGPPTSLGLHIQLTGAVGGWTHFFTNYGEYKGCIGFNFASTCWAISEGSVSRNLFDDNIVLRTDGLGNRLDVNGLLFQGSGWLLGSYAQWFRNNISADAGGLANNFTGLIDQYSFASINVPSVNNNFAVGQPGYYLAWTPNSEGVSTAPAVWPPTATPANCTGIDNSATTILQWDNNEGYGASRHQVMYTLGTSGSQSQTAPTSTVNQTMSHQTAWGVYHFARFPYGEYRVVYDTWFVRADHAQAAGFDVNTDYNQSEITYLNWDMEGYTSLVSNSQQFGTQVDSDLPDQNGPGRLMVRGGRYKVDELLYLQLGDSSEPADHFYGMQVIVGGDRTTGTAADAVTVINANGGNPIVFYMNFRDISQLNNFQYNVGANLTMPKTFQLNRWNGHNYDVYPWVQNPDQILPQSHDPNHNPPQVGSADTWGCPEAGLTNQQCHDKYSPLPAHRANVTQTEYQGVLKAGWPDPVTPGMCYGNILTPGTAVSVTWISGPLTGAVPNGKADQVS